MNSTSEKKSNIAFPEGPLTIESISPLHGAGYFSAGPVVILRLNLGDFDEVFTNSIQNFSAALQQILPGLSTHHCSEGHEGGFLKRLQEGTLLGHVAEHVALELQSMAGMDVSFGKTRSTNTAGVYNVVFRFLEENAGIFAGKAAVSIINTLLKQESTEINAIIAHLEQLKQNSMADGSTLALTEEMRQRDIPVLFHNTGNLIQLGTGKYQKKIKQGLFSQAPYTLTNNASDSFTTLQMLQKASVPVSLTLQTADLEEAIGFFKSLGQAVSISNISDDNNYNHYTSLSREEDIMEAFLSCQTFGPNVLVQEQKQGNIYQLLVINKKFIAACSLEESTRDVTGMVHPINRFLAERAAAICGLDVAGILIVTDDISKPMPEANGSVFRILRKPDLGLHMSPHEGKSRDVITPLADMLFPENIPNRIPIFAIAGSAGKSLCAYMISFMLEKEGITNGMCHSDGIFSAGRKIAHDNFADFHGAQKVLMDPSIESAIVEVSTQSILNQGLGYPFADMGIVLNVHDEYTESDYVSNREDLAYTMSVVGEEVYREGWTLLNAADPLVIKMQERLYSRLALFSSDTNDQTFKKHCLKGGLAVGCEHETIYLWSKHGKHCLAKLEETPLWAGGKNEVFLDAIMAACLAMAAFDLAPDRIGELLKAFKPAHYSTHGRLMEVYLGHKTLIIDRPPSLQAMNMLKKKLAAQQEKPSLYIDLSGDLPNTFWKNFSKSFEELQPKVKMFFSEPRLKPAKQEVFNNDPGNIIFTSQHNRAKQPFQPEMTKEQILAQIKKFMGEAAFHNFRFTLVEDISAVISGLTHEDHQKLSLLFSWNFNSLFNELSKNSDFVL